MKDFFSKLAVGASQSTALRIDFTDIKKIVINALIVGASTTVLYVTNAISSADFGVYTPIVVPIITAGLEFLYRFLKNNTPKEE